MSIGMIRLARDVAVGRRRLHHLRFAGGPDCRQSPSDAWSASKFAVTCSRFRPCIARHTDWKPGGTRHEGTVVAREYGHHWCRLRRQVAADVQPYLQALPASLDHIEGRKDVRFKIARIFKAHRDANPALVEPHRGSLFLVQRAMGCGSRMASERLRVT